MSILSLSPALALVFALVLLGAQIMKRSFLEQNLKKIFWVPIAAIFALSVVFSIIQYSVWRNNELMKLILKQADNGLGVFFFSSFMNHFAPHVLSLVLAGIFAVLMFLINKRSGGKFFEREEIYIAFLAGFLTGFPGFLFFLLSIVVVYLITHLVFAAINKTAKSGVIPLYYFWLPISASVILISTIWLSKLGFWGYFSI